MERFKIVNNGYDINQVNSFIKKIINDEKILVNKVNELQKQVNELNKNKNLVINKTKSNSNILINDTLIKLNNIKYKKQKLETELSIITDKLNIIRNEIDKLIKSVENNK